MTGGRFNEVFGLLAYRQDEDRCLARKDLIGNRCTCRGLGKLVSRADQVIVVYV